MDVHISLQGRKDLSREIYRQLRTAILEGRLDPGSVLPPTRHLAERLKVARMTKTLLPTLRVGFIVSPPSLLPALSRAIFVSDWHTSTLVQATLAQLIETGAYARHLRRVNSRYRERHGLITQILSSDFASDLQVVPSSTGLHVTTLAPAMSIRQLEAIHTRAAERAVALRLLSRLFVARPPVAGLVLGYGAIDLDGIKEGLRRLRRCFYS